MSVAPSNLTGANTGNLVAHFGSPRTVLPATTGLAVQIGVMVAFLASDLSAYTTGTIITIDGGAANRGPMF